MIRSPHPEKIRIGCFLGLLFIFLVNGCIPKPSPDAPRADDSAWNASVASPPAKETGPEPDGSVRDMISPDQPEIVLEQAAPTARSSGLPTQKIYMEMKEVDLAVLLRTLARIADQNIMISQHVRGKATINIRNEAWDKVFLNLLSTYGLTHFRDGRIIRVMTLEDMKKDFSILEMIQKKKAKREEIDSLLPRVTRVINVEFSEAENLKKIFDEILKNDQGEKRGVVMVDPYTNALVVQASQKDINQLTALARELDRPTYQVRIEARVVEANGDTARELGVEWGGLYKGQSRNYWITPGVNSSDTEDSGDLFSEDGELSPDPGFFQELPAVLTEVAKGNGLSIGFIAAKAGQHALSVQLSAYESQGKLKILSSPSISTLDNQKAVIESGREIPYQTVEDDDVSIEFKKAVLKLEVIPHVINGNVLKLKLSVFKDELDFNVSVANGNPAILTKNAETSVLLYDGQTTVIGGLRKESVSDTNIGVPLLKDIPLLGHLFRRDSKSSESEEVLIFITPHILRDGILQHP
ncbi:hypothetical protein DENIS_0058 [Desulfonema ishimotonii]|uniref:Uncharacterized protein n=1 Tax=Desulfonema ishimotonii TaxID=45657 RepID=A0A401FQC8_9BACT|nr:type IV pilus secretin PilQ [Desulfonema ishimotonii]GBC59122.1 hypothetical protein DENIS_0058 [Desulfonema ishimotonii]